MELEGEDCSVCAVVSLYGPTNLEEMYYHTNQHLTTRSRPGKPKKDAPAQMPKWIIRKMGKDYYRLGMNKGFENGFAVLLGGHPDECPDAYTLFSPITHVNSDCPPTLLIHGEHDVMVPVRTIRSLHARLIEQKVQSVMHILPQTDHAFDLQLPGISPSAHNAIYDVERFLALMVNKTNTKNKEYQYHNNVI
jgi:acetyl esterase/lipase